MRGATGRTKRPGRRNKGPGAESSGGQRVKTKRTGLGALARRDGGDGPEEQSCAGLGGRAGDRCGGFPGGSAGKDNLPEMWETWVQSLGWT